MSRLNRPSRHQPSRRLPAPRRRLLAGAVSLVVSIGVFGIPSAGAAEGDTILIFGPTLAGLPVNEQTIAEASGTTVIVWSEEQWASATTEEFAAFDAIVFGDPDCASSTSGVLDVAIANRETWSPAVTGPKIVIGTDPIFHANTGGGEAVSALALTVPEAAATLTANAMNFAAGGSGTGLYVSLSCYYFDAAPNTPVDLLDQFGAITVQGQTEDAVTIEDEAHPSMNGLTSEDLSGWGVSVHEVLDGSPGFSDIVTEDISGLPYIIATSGGGPEEGADLSVTKSDAAPFGPDPVSSGGQVAYRISVSNGGSDAATGVQVVDDPTGGTVVRGTGTGWTCSIDSESNTATCDLAGSLASDEIAPDLIVEVQAPATTTDTFISDTATVSAIQSDPNPGNNSDTESTTVQGTSNPASRDHAQAFYDGTQQVKISTTRDTIGGFYSSLVIPPGLQPGVVSIDEFPASGPVPGVSNPATFCGGGPCAFQIQVTVLPGGRTSANKPINVFWFYPKRSEGDRLFVKGDNESVASRVPLCSPRNVANPAKCLSTIIGLEDGPGKRYKMLWRDGGDPIGGKRR